MERQKPLRSLLPQSVELHARLRELHESPAPFLWPGGTWFRQQVKRVAMGILRPAGRNQREFNERARDVLTLLAAEVRGMRQFLEERAPFLDGPGSIGCRIDAIERGLDRLQGHFGSIVRGAQRRDEDLRGEQERLVGLAERLRSQLEEQAAVVQRHTVDLRQSAALLQQHGPALEQQQAVVEEQRQRVAGLIARVAALGDVSPWVALLQRRVEAMALDLREIVARQRELPAPRLVDGERFRKRLAEMGDEVRVNIGCGERPWPDYINVDWRELPDVDVVGDARLLPFEPGTIAELASSHLVEHFREHELRTHVLPYWKSLIKRGGRMRIICPNWQAMLQRLSDGRMTLPHFKQVTFGAQDYEGDDHFAMYTPDTLGALLLDSGFESIEMVTPERMNGLCPEMEMVAHLAHVPSHQTDQMATGGGSAG